MKHNHNHDNGPGQQLIPVHFEFTHPTATHVCIAGTFNNWQPEAKTLHSSGAGNWWKDTALAPGTYEYCLIVDGQWMPDPLAKKSVANPWRPELGAGGGRLARGRPSGRRDKFTVEKIN